MNQMKKGRQFNTALCLHTQSTEVSAQTEKFILLLPIIKRYQRTPFCALQRAAQVHNNVNPEDYTAVWRIELWVTL